LCRSPSPRRWSGWLILLAQWIFYIGFFVLYLISRRTAHRLVGYFEEEAVLSYTLYLAEIDSGRAANVPAPGLAMRYWKLPADATLRDVVLRGARRRGAPPRRQPRLCQPAFGAGLMRLRVQGSAGGHAGA
jgi:hypothetical protein